MKAASPSPRQAWAIHRVGRIPRLSPDINIL
jgi:hypothetical protein